MSQDANKKDCGDCHACCIAFSIAEAQKRDGQPCRHLASRGCAIYADRPATCADFWCLWAIHPDMPDELRPDRCGVICSRVLRDNGVRMMERREFGNPETRKSVWRWLMGHGYRPLLRKSRLLRNTVILVEPGLAERKPAS